MTVKFNGRKYEFRPVDTQGITPDQLQHMADTTGRMQYEPRAAWLVIPTVGYGWEVFDSPVEIY